jgi:tetratricopeptide (TPR) repeat protein
MIHATTIDIRAYRYLKAAHESWYESGDHLATLEWVNRALKVSPDFVEALLLKADLLYETDNEDAAISLLDDMLAASPDCLEAYLSKVAMLMTMGKYRLALLICQEALFQARRVSNRDRWLLPYLFRHKVNLQILLHRFWAAKQTLDVANTVFEANELKQLQEQLYRERTAYARHRAKRRKLNAV